MKMWVQPEVEELSFEETMYGGCQSGNYDFMWMEEDGSVHSMFCCGS